MKGKYFLFFISIFVLIIFTIRFIGKSTYSLGGQRGYSNSLQESTERKTFVKELDYKITPNNLKLNLVFFIEKGFRYGRNSILQSDTLINDSQPYQLICGCKVVCEKYKSCNYDCDIKQFTSRDTIISLKGKYHKKLKLKRKSIKDTIIYDILVNRNIYEVDTIGQIKVWDKIKQKTNANNTYK